MTSLGDLDLFAEVPGGGTDENLLPSTVETQVAGFRVLCVTLEKLIDLKLAAGRHKDLTVAAELQVLLEEKRKLAD
jgi:predicted nucleotidyltransferase